MRHNARIIDRDSLVLFWRREALSAAREKGHRTQNISAIEIKREGSRVLGIVKCIDCHLKGAIDTNEYNSEKLTGLLYEFNCVKSL